ncbi:MAG: twin-arginine translocase TatA/TatE family subunit [Anaerolineae bacterium]|jgi:sec-independent protein translocase protein TatB|nr:twin-arginine translocase TatA/TatE family subunit [Anaerolineae bacterium]
MKIFNFGIPEFLVLLVLMIVVLGPERMIEGARSLGRTVYKITHSEVWSSIWQTSREIRSMPKKIVEETGLEESLADIQATGEELQKDMSGVQADLNGIKLETGQELKKSENAVASLTKNPPKSLEKNETSVEPDQPSSTLSKPTSLEK